MKLKSVFFLVYKKDDNDVLARNDKERNLERKKLLLNTIYR